MRHLRRTQRLLSLILGSLVGGLAYAQPAPTDAPAEDVKVLGIDHQEYLDTQSALLDAFDDPEIKALTRQIERLIERRDKLLLRKAKERRPELSTHLDTVGREREKSRRPANPEDTSLETEPEG